MTVKLYQTKEWLESIYSKDKNSDPKIAMICKVSQPTIGNWRKKFCIKTRPHGESIHLQNTNCCNLDSKSISWISGELLGDGCIQSNSNYSACFAYTSKYLEYIKYVSNILKSSGIEQAGKIGNLCFGIYHGYEYTSRNYAELLPIRKKWYPQGKKIVPRDIKLTPLVCRQWYIGDGCLTHSKTSSCILLSTCGFPIPDVEFLKEGLLKLGFKSTRQPSGNTIRISVYSTKDFLNYIGPCPVQCYQYKWNYYNKKGG